MYFKNNKELGSWGEKRASEYLIENGYVIIESNYRTNMGEIDIIALNKDFLVFVEVKTRRNSFFGPPQAAVGYSKQKKIKNIALYYLLNSEYRKYDLRFDVISILYSNEEIKIEHFKNCF